MRSATVAAIVSPLSQRAGRLAALGYRVDFLGLAVMVLMMSVLYCRTDGLPLPVTLFLNRDRTIRAIYTGFWGPATGGTHEKTVATFQRLTKEILASRR